MLNNLIRSRNPHFKISFPTGNGKEIDLPLMNIQYIKADGVVSQFYMAGYERNKITITQSIGICEMQLKAYAFVRIHRKYLINYSWIEKMILDDKLYCQLYGGTELPVSRRQQKELMQEINYYQLDHLF